MDSWLCGGAGVGTPNPMLFKGQLYIRNFSASVGYQLLWNVLFPDHRMYPYSKSQHLLNAPLLWNLTIHCIWMTMDKGKLYLGDKFLDSKNLIFDWYCTSGRNFEHFWRATEGHHFTVSQAWTVSSITNGRYVEFYGLNIKSKFSRGIIKIHGVLIYLRETQHT